MTRGRSDTNTRPTPANGTAFLSGAVLGAVEGPASEYENLGVADSSSKPRLAARGESPAGVAPRIWLGIEAEKRRVSKEIRGASTTKSPSQSRKRCPRDFFHGLLDPSNPANTPPLRKSNSRISSRHGGFTLVEVLAAMLLIAIVLPVVMQGITAGAGASSTTRRRTEASGLAEAKLNELIATGDWQGGVLSGDFAPDWPDYHWQATVTGWTQDTTNSNLQEIDLRVFWKADNREDAVTVASLAYNRTPQ